MNKIVMAGGLAAAVLVLTSEAAAHCDTLDGPVVKAARAALDQRNVALVLRWVPVADEPEITRAFDQTVTVRALGPAAQELADRFFFETVVRVHRAGEGVPYTGLKPAGTPIDPALSIADRAVETGNLNPVLERLTADVQHGVRRAFTEMMVRREAAPPADVVAGRAFVTAYVTFIHLVETIGQAARGGPGGHDRPSPDAHTVK
jgi:hypothetical protein